MENVTPIKPPPKVPVNLRPTLINKVVSIQIIPRESPNSDTVCPDRMLKIAGTLQAYLYTVGQPEVHLQIQGDRNMIKVNLITHSLELYGLD